MAMPVVLLPGMMCDARVWMPQIIALSPRRAVHVATITQGETIEEIAQSVLADAPERFALAGLSMGGIVAMDILRAAPQRVERLALFDTNCQAELPNVAAAREPMIVAARSGRLEEALRTWMTKETLAPGALRAQVMNTVLDMGMYLGSDVFVRQSRALQKRPDQQPTLRKAKLPTLVACGEHDRMTPPRRHEFMAHLIPNARLEIIADAGHLPMLENPERVVHVLEDWLVM